MGSPASYRNRTMRLSYRCDAEVFVPAYRLAPENPFPAALDDALTAWKLVKTLRRDAPFFVAGDSAGGGLICRPFGTAATPASGRAERAAARWRAACPRGRYRERDGRQRAHRQGNAARLAAYPAMARRESGRVAGDPHVRGRAFAFSTACRALTRFGTTRADLTTS
jgi:hypothetical protein